MEQAKNSETSLLPKGLVIAERYQILDKLGAGGFATVYRARHLTMGCDIALKVMELQKDFNDPTYVERFAREAKIAAKIKHDNVVNIYDYGKIPETGQPYIAMELLVGHDLDEELVLHGPVSPSRAYKLFLPVLEALGQGHQLGIVHKDLKPANLYILNPDYSTEMMKVLDFGVARVNSSEYAKLTGSGQLMGTPRYLAPEYIKSQTVTPAIDVYQMALIICESMTGLNAVNCDTPYNAMMGHMLGQLNIHPFFKEGRMGEVFKKALNSDYTKRYKDCNEFVAALGTVADLFESIVPLETKIALVDNDGVMKTSLTDASVLEADGLKALDQPPLVENPNADAPGTGTPGTSGSSPAPENPPSPPSANPYENGGIPPELNPEVQLENARKAKRKLIIAVVSLSLLFVVSFVIILILYNSKNHVPATDKTAVQEETPEPEVVEAVPLTRDEIIALPSAERESEWLRFLELPEPEKETAEMKQLHAKADEGDNESLMKLGVAYMKLPPHRMNIQHAYEALSAVKNFTDTEALFFYALLDYNHYSHAADNPDDIRQKALKKIQQAASHQFGPGLVFMMDHVDESSMNPVMLEQSLYDYYEKNGKPEDYYKLGLMGENKAKKSAKKDINNSIKEFISMYRDACDNGYQPACLGYVSALMCSDSKKAFAKLDESVTTDVPEACGRIAEYYIMASEPDMGNVPDYLCYDSAMKQFKLELKRLQNQEKDIVDLIKRSDGYMNLEIMHEHLKMNAADHFDLMQKLENKILERDGYSREICDKLAKVNYIERQLSSDENEIFFDTDQLKAISGQILNCYQNAFTFGHDWYRNDVKRYSTAAILAGLYEGSDAWKVPAEPDKRLAVLIYGAQSGDGVSQALLAREYDLGGTWAKDPERACFWAKKASASEICKLCGTDEGKELSACTFCEDNATYVTSCTK